MSDIPIEFMLIVPHPDDEVFSVGGYFSHLADQERATACLTLTRGGAGRTLGLCSQEELPAVREAELRASWDILGVSEQILWDYPDGALKDVDHEALARAIAQEIDRLRPRTLLTFPPNGSNGHYDHITCHRVVIAALELCDHQPEKLFYFATETASAGVIRDDFMPPEDVKALHLPPTHYLDMTVYIERKIRAMGQYETQARSVLAFMRKLPRKLLHESFHQARPSYPDQGPMTVNRL